MERKFVLRVLVNAVAIYFVANYLSGSLSVTGLGSALAAALILGIANAIIRPILLFFTLPINLLTIGLFTFVINGLMLQLTDLFVSGMSVSGFWGAVWASILISIVSLFINSLVMPHNGRRYK
jgi:putative membrane protein